MPWKQAVVYWIADGSVAPFHTSAVEPLPSSVLTHESVPFCCGNAHGEHAVVPPPPVQQHGTAPPAPFAIPPNVNTLFMV